MQRIPVMFLVEERIVKFMRKKVIRFFSLIPNLSRNLLVRVISALARKDTFVVENLGIYQSVRSFIVRKNTEIEKRRHMEKCVRLMTEHGFPDRMFRDIPDYTQFGLNDNQNGYRHYNGLLDYIEKNTLVVPLSLDKLTYLFRVYFSLVTAFLVLSLIHYSVKAISTRRIRNRFRRTLLFGWKKNCRFF